MGVCCAGSGSPGGGSRRDEVQEQVKEHVTHVWVRCLPGGGVLWRLRSSGREARGGEDSKHSVGETNTLRSRQPVGGGDDGTVCCWLLLLSACIKRPPPNPLSLSLSLFFPQA